MPYPKIKHLIRRSTARFLPERRASCASKAWGIAFARGWFISLIATALLLGALTATAQAAIPVAAYTGPCFPSGPDSLRALVYRATRLAASGTTERVALKFELAGSQKAKGLRIVPPPKAAAGDLVSAAATALDYLRAHKLAARYAQSPGRCRPGSQSCVGPGFCRGPGDSALRRLAAGIRRNTNLRKSPRYIQVYLFYPGLGKPGSAANSLPQGRPEQQ